MKKHLTCLVIALVIGAISAGLGYRQGLKLRTKKKTDDTMQRISAIESSHNPNAISPKGARGQYQIMRPTWDECVKLMGVDWDYDTDWKNPAKNKAVGEYYFNTRIPAMLKAYNVPDTQETRLACYNGGIGRVNRAWEKGGANGWKQYLPKETRDYIVKFATVQ